MDSKEGLIQNLIKEGYLKSPQIISAFKEIDRADFVLPANIRDAYHDYPLPIGEGQTISQPLTVAFMLELLQPEPGDKILDAGAGSGWTTALLAHITAQNGLGKVIGIERIKEVCQFGQKNLKKYFSEDKAEIICGDASVKFIQEAYFDKILAGASAADEIPESWRKQLKTGGRIVAPVKNSVWLFVKKAENSWEEYKYPGFSFVPLVKESGIKNPPARQESSPENKNPKKRLNIFLASCFLLFASALALANEIYFPHTSYAGNKRVEIPEGYGSRKIGQLLAQEGVIRSKWVFVTYVSLKGKASRLKPGIYNFGRLNIPQISGQLISGVSETTFTIPEGWTVREIKKYLEESSIGNNDSFMQLTTAQGSKNFTGRFPLLKEKPAGQGLEGFLFPDTYRVFSDASNEAVISKMLDNLEKKITPEMREEVKSQGKDFYHILVMASLIEKEVISDEDRALVSGILWKRLEIGMALQVDATLTYVKKERASRPEEISSKISIEDTQINSSYNTYKYVGLPPGPISNPGLSSIKAAIFPQKSPYLFYLSTPEGKTIFSRNLNEHNTAKAKYLR